MTHKINLYQTEIKLTLIGIVILSLTACNTKPTDTADNNSTDTSGAYHGYNELANPDNRKTFTISDFNTDNPDITNIQRPSASSIKTNLDTTLLFGIWTSDPDGPHADFELTSKSFYVVDYDGDGDMPYELNDTKLKIYYNDFIQEGKIISVSKDTLKIQWKDFDNINNYVKWTQ